MVKQDQFSLPRSVGSALFLMRDAALWRTRCAKLNNIEAHHHIVVFMFEVVAVHQVAPPIPVESHDDADVVA